MSGKNCDFTIACDAKFLSPFQISTKRVKPVPELQFKGKEFVFNHHLTVPFRPLEPNSKKSFGDESENLIVHGDNLHALKALLPRYAGKVDCIFIDPPYNTGEESWVYNDNVNSPLMKEWLDSNPVNKEDMLRHDKWACLMYPRLKLLHELLANNGSIWITLDDGEVHRARLILDEIYGEQNHEATICWQKRYTRSNNATRFSSSKDHLIVYRKSDAFQPGKEVRSDESRESYDNSDDDPNGPWISVSYVNPALKEERENLVYPIENPRTGKMVEHETNAWKFKYVEHQKHIKENRLWWGETGELTYPRLKVYLKDGVVPIDLWTHKFAGTTDQAFSEIENILWRKAFPTPKPAKLLQRIMELATSRDSLVLDSFAGSATTAHAVLAQNARDNGSRRFILVECEDYADEVTAERVRRAINGYEFKGTQKEELLRKKITWSNFSKDTAHKNLLNQVLSLENLEADRFDSIKKTVKDGELIVSGETKVTERVEGLGGGFTYYTLGEPLDLDQMLSGKSLPDYPSIGAWLFHTATGEPLDLTGIKEKQYYLGESSAFHVWLIYKPELDFLKSRDAALTLSFAEMIAKESGKRHLVFAPARFVPNKMLLPLGVEYAPLPFALYRLEKN